MSENVLRTHSRFRRIPGRGTGTAGDFYLVFSPISGGSAWRELNGMAGAMADQAWLRLPVTQF